MNLKSLLRLYTPTISIVIFLLLLAHTFSLWNIEVDTISVTLILLLMVIPLLPKLKKLKWGDFEAEITNDEVKKIEEESEKLLPLPPSEAKGYERSDVDEIVVSLFTLVKTDPTLALAKLRIVLEDVVGKIYKLQVKNNVFKENGIPLSKKIDLVLSDEMSRNQYLSVALDVIAVCNRAIHGEKISEATATNILLIGSKLVGYFYGYYAAYSSELLKLRSNE